MGSPRRFGRRRACSLVTRLLVHSINPSRQGILAEIPPPNPYGLGPRIIRGLLDFTGDWCHRTRQKHWTLPGLAPLASSTYWTLPGPYPNSRLIAPRDGAIRAGIGGFDGFRMMPVAPSKATSASG